MPLRIVTSFWILLLLPMQTFASVTDFYSQAKQASMQLREREAWSATRRDSQFASIVHTSMRPNCEATRPPEALATPNPLLELSDSDAPVKVSFIIGTDGRVHSPFILQSSNPSEDRIVLNAVRSWRYRPAMCNGVPTEIEARIGFSGR